MMQTKVLVEGAMGRFDSLGDKGCGTESYAPPSTSDGGTKEVGSEIIIDRQAPPDVVKSSGIQNFTVAI